MRIFPSFLIATAVLLLVGCTDVTLSNLTPNKAPENHSSLYTIAIQPHIKNIAIQPESLRCVIVIDGKTLPMMPSKTHPGVFEVDYQMPEGRSEVKYYITTHYSVATAPGGYRSGSTNSELFTLTLTNRYVITLESQRGPVGAVVAVVGRGFTPFDKVSFDGTEAETTYHSPNSLSFVVPMLSAEKTYNPVLRTGTGELPLGSFRIDSSVLQSHTSHLHLHQGERSLISLSIRSAAPGTGIPLEVTTDVPDSVIMPEATIPAGSRSVSIPIEGGQPGSGTIYITAPGFKEIEIAVDVIDPNAFLPAGTSGFLNEVFVEDQAVTITPVNSPDEVLVPWQPLND